MNRDDFQKLAEIRAAEAKALLDQGFFDGAYYLAGYPIEFALKACFAKQVRQYDFPHKYKVVQDLYSHDLNKLRGLSGLEEEFRKEDERSSDFAKNWNTVKDWSEEARYERHDERKARDMVFAVLDGTTGILPWLKARW